MMRRGILALPLLQSPRMIIRPTPNQALIANLGLMRQLFCCAEMSDLLFLMDCFETKYQNLQPLHFWTQTKSEANYFNSGSSANSIIEVGLLVIKDSSLDKSLFRPLNDQLTIAQKNVFPQKLSGSPYLISINQGRKSAIRKTTHKMSQSLLFDTEPELSNDMLEESHIKELSQTKFETKVTGLPSGRSPISLDQTKTKLSGRTMSRNFEFTSKTTTLSWVKAATGLISDQGRYSSVYDQFRNPLGFSWNKTTSGLPLRQRDQFQRGKSLDSLPSWDSELASKRRNPPTLPTKANSREEQMLVSRAQRQREHYQSTVPLPGACAVAAYNSKSRKPAHGYCEYLFSELKISKSTDLDRRTDSYYSVIN